MSGGADGIVSTELAAARKRLQAAGIADPLLDARLLVADVTGFSLTDFVMKPDHPVTREESARIAAMVERRAGGEPVHQMCIRDSGQEEENPALGWRAIRLSLDRPGLMRTQMRALLRAASGAELRMMLPMVTEVSEIRAARDLLQKEVQHLSKFSHALPKKLQFGAMLEVPSLMWQLDELMQEVDFVSVGSNDLFQFSMAVDRGNARVSDRFDNLGKPFLRILRDIVRAGEKHHTSVTLCGEMASKPLSAMALIGLGFRSVSMSPTAIGPVKAMLLGLDAASLADELNAALDDHNSLEMCIRDSPGCLSSTVFRI